ncbi:MAG: LemA family protein [Acidobacteriia bacterium]|nr:LemA family protein [Terriglobia bacterium]
MRGWIGCGVAALVLLVIVLSVVGWGVGVYNGLVRSQVTVDTAWSQVQNVYQRRMDLIPNLVETVKGAANFEKSTFTEVTEARAKASQMVLTPELLNDPARFRQFQQAQGELSGAISRLLVTVENYPQLTASQNFRELQSQLEGAENRIAVERRRFNETVQAYNTAIRVFPASMLAGLFGFQPKAFFEAEPGAEKAPKVKF